MSTTSTPKKGTVPPSDWQERFLKHLAQYGNASKAAQYARVSRNFVYAQRKTDPAFANAWAEALDGAADVLEAEAWRRAVKGTKREKGVYYEGKEIAREVIREYSDTLLIFLLKGARPEKYRERSEVRHTTEPIDWEKVPPEIRDAFIERKLTADDVRRLTAGL